MNISGTTKVCGLIANPVGHSLSPLMHNFIAQQMNVDMVYVPFTVPIEKLKEAVDGAFSCGILGMNATIPHKIRVMPYLVGIDENAKRIGAVNTLVRQEDGYYGYNTDYMGLERSLREDGLIDDIAGKPVILLGAGGAAKAAALLLADLGATQMIILNRTKERADSLAKELALLHPALSIKTAATADWEQVLSKDSKYFVLQTTSVGMFPKTQARPIEDEAFYDYVVSAYDIVYNPGETEFMKSVRSHGGVAAGGLNMLLYQGIAAFELWNDVTVPDRVAALAYRQMRRALGFEEDIYLIGFMGAGKSSVGRNLARLLDNSFSDTDNLIEEQEHRTIKEIFDKDGEPVFRDMETALVAKLSSNASGRILAVGGGLPVREENRNFMLRSGKIIYLKAGLKTLAARLSGDTKRPLLAGGNVEDKIASLMSARASIYEECADVIFDTDGLNVHEVARKLQDLLYKTEK